MFKINFRFFVFLFILIPLICGSTPKNSEALCIKNERANLRKGPGTNHEKLWEVFKYMPFKQLGVKGAWKRIQDVDGDIYWVHGPLTTQKYKCAVIKNNKKIAAGLVRSILQGSTHQSGRDLFIRYQK